jgi:ATP-dependent DNA ligase
MNITEYVAANAAAKPNADIQERWESRIVAQGMHLRGRRGAENYLGQYGKGLKAPKAIAFARISEIKGFPEVAARFWEEAFFLATGQRAAFAASGETVAQVSLPPVALKEAFGRTPQLPVFVDHARIEELMLDDGWGMQEKFDGRNAMVDVEAGSVSGGNKKGLAVAVPLQVADEAVKLTDIKFDAENVNGVFYAFDAPSLGGQDLRKTSYQRRHELLWQEAERFLAPAGSLRVIPLVTGRAAKFAFREKLRSRRAEGFILKRLSAEYESGDSHGNQVKFQFRATNAFIVGQRNGDKDSFQISVMRADGSLRDMGNMKVSAGRKLTPGSVVDVEYLYCNLGATGKLQQAVFKIERDDASPSDCVESKIKFKAESED